MLVGRGRWHVVQLAGLLRSCHLLVCHTLHRSNEWSVEAAVLVDPISTIAGIFRVLPFAMFQVTVLLKRVRLGYSSVLRERWLDPGLNSDIPLDFCRRYRVLHQPR